VVPGAWVLRFCLLAERDRHNLEILYREPAAKTARPAGAAVGEAVTRRLTRQREEGTMVDWTIKAREFVNCNCAYGCPCQFNAPPTHGDCKAIAGLDIEEGHHRATRLDGLKAVAVMAWPGPIHEGSGQAQLIIDQQATSAQRASLLRILAGEDTEPGATVWQVFSTTFTKVHDPIFAPIEFFVDIERRAARLLVPSVIEGRGEPIRNPVTGAEHRPRIDLPNGFEYRVAEMGRGWSTSEGAIKIDLADTLRPVCEYSSLPERHGALNAYERWSS
jgi:hypothetical protein